MIDLHSKLEIVNVNKNNFLMSMQKKQQKCIMVVFRKGDRLAPSPECLGLFNLNVMH